MSVDWQEISNRAIYTAVGSIVTLAISGGIVWGRRLFSPNAGGFSVSAKQYPFEMPPLKTIENPPVPIMPKGSKVHPERAGEETHIPNPPPVPITECYESRNIDTFDIITITNKGTEEALSVTVEIPTTGITNVDYETIDGPQSHVYRNQKIVPLPNIPVGRRVTIKHWSQGRWYRSRPPLLSHSKGAIFLDHRSWFTKHFIDSGRGMTVVVVMGMIIAFVAMAMEISGNSGTSNNESEKNKSDVKAR